MLADLEGGSELYAVYRYLCGFTHASPTLTDQYLHLDESPGSIGYGFDPHPPELDRAPHIRFVASSMLWALSAVRFILKDGKTLRSDLRNAARELGIRPDLQLTAKALARQNGHVWGGNRKPTDKTVRTAAKAKGLYYAHSPGTATDVPLHHIWLRSASPAAVSTFSTLDEAAAYVSSFPEPVS
ncbi:hypothetical protein I0Q12_02775 [Rhodococcus sp. CX]|nr:hypothetical protein [Rhodococcus sp. CX]